MIYTIENDKLKVEIDSLGAQLMSVYGKQKQTEYLWQGNPEYWTGRAPILFPICGRLFSGKCTFEGKEYETPKHGLVRNMEMSVKDKTDTSISFEVKSDESTKKLYPFDFKFTTTFSVDGATLTQSFIIENDGDKVLPFSLGAHPGFNVPLGKNEKFEDYYIEFDRTRAIKEYVLSDTCFYTGKTREYTLDNGKFDLKHSLFDIDGVFLETQADTVNLKSRKSDNGVSIKYEDMTSLGFWHKPQSDAPYVCIEPWHGIPSFDGVVDDLATKHLTIKLDPKKVYRNTMEITVK